MGRCSSNNDKQKKRNQLENLENLVENHTRTEKAFRAVFSYRRQGQC